jgi:hypothetical protein
MHGAPPRSITSELPSLCGVKGSSYTPVSLPVVFLIGIQH